ncbi:TonB-dependent receptor [Chitinophaga sp. Cy-1792]|uniref:TonB-dependent receptor n=1 Tax=Chitinophaga sp. Cy-1792 TaxID=2608339 RepID=UPI0014229BF6|nr:TonB-dependent receptor [Chitinophaga sp. Cy-1792]NIG54812.1 outer membrane beta-barrel protein [Chitinophaga sp. Cy-1792]
MKKILLFLTLLCLAQGLHAQHAVIRGQVTDTLNRNHLPNAVVAVLRAKDSILYKFQRTTADGKFELKNLQPGNYLVSISYPKFADYVEPVTLDSSTVKEMGNIGVIQKSKLLQEVVIKQQVAAIRFKGDTTEFNADSFKTAANANVEDLLKILPGIQVDSKGQITAMGQTVKKVLVDGEEFFGDDPTLVTKNLRADMVDKVQLFDKSSDQAAFTGVDDGNKSRTINIKLKEDKKRGYFGKIDVGGATEGYFNTELMFNLFRGKKKFAAYGIASNLGKTGLNWDERDRFGSSNAENMSVEDNGDMYFYGSGDDDLGGWGGRFDGQGFPLSQNAGVHYEDKWNEDKHRVNLNAKAMHLGVEQWSQNLNQTVLNNQVQITKDTSSSKNSTSRMTASGIYELKLDTLSSVKFTVKGGKDNSSSLSQSHGTVTDDEGNLLNESHNRRAGNGDRNYFSTEMLWRQKFKKIGRTVSLSIAQNYNKDNNTALQESEVDVYKTGKLDTTMMVDQHKISNSELFHLSGTATYTEPLSKKSSMVFTYGLDVNNNQSGRSSYNKDAGGKYTDLDSLYSNDFAYNVMTNKGGLGYSYNTKKVKFSANAIAGSTNYTQENMFTGNLWKRSFVNYYPNARFVYSMGPQRSLRFSYNGYSRQPSVQQLQPLVSNDNQINIFVGNPDLRPAFNSNFSIGYGDYQVMKERGMWAWLSFNMTNNDFSTSTITDASGRSKTTTVNVNGNSTIYLNLSYNWKVKPLNTRFDISTNSNYRKTTNFVNLQENHTNAANLNLRIGANTYKEKKYEQYFSFSANYNSSVSSIQKSLTTSYMTYSLYESLTLRLPYHFEVNSNIDYSIRPKTDLFTTNNNQAIWGASVAKKFGKEDAFQVRASVEDILQQRLGINRFSTANVVTQQTYGIIGRYAMLSFVWNFKKFGGAPAAK